jgi:hypothetical protein
VEGIVVTFKRRTSLIKSSRILKIDINETGPSKSATIYFEKPSAAKTALMVRLSLFLWQSSSRSALAQLNGSSIDHSSPLSVNSDTVHPDEEDSETTHVPGTPLDQSDKPRAGSMHVVFFTCRLP